jgi:aspartyl-tRNA(Asn)/glutamyl-tRNA(Gln) amidotransferase subunit C
MAERLSLEEVRHVAALARLKLSDEELELYRTQLASVLEHIARLQRIDVEGVEPLAHPHDLTARLEADEVAPSMPRQRVLEIAPAVEETYLAVPKVLDHGGGP